MARQKKNPDKKKGLGYGNLSATYAERSSKK